MTVEKLYSLLCRVCFFASFALLCLIAVEKIVNVSGYTVLRGYSSERILSLATVLLLFVVAILLREIREALSAKRP